MTRVPVAGQPRGRFGRVVRAAVVAGALASAPAVVTAAVVAGALASAPAAVAQGPGNPLTPGIPFSTPAISTPTTSTIATLPTTSGGSSSFSGGSAIAIAIGAAVVLGGISFFIWRDARRRAPVRHRAATAVAGDGGRSATKPKPKARKPSPAERRRRKRGRAR